MILSTVIFGNTVTDIPELEEMATMVYETFRIPFVTMAVLREGASYQLSSLSNARYSRLSRKEHALLNTMLEG
jgi:hypothetical protein